MTSDGISEILQQQESEINTFAVDQLKQSFRLNSNPILLRKFNNLFKNDGKNMPREWPEIPEERIKEIFDKSKVQVTAVLDQFRLIDFPLGIATYVCKAREENPADLDHQASVDLSVLLSSNVKMAKNRASSIAISRVLSEDDINRVKNQFEDDCTGTYDEAINRHVSLHSIITFAVILLLACSQKKLSYLKRAKYLNNFRINIDILSFCFFNAEKHKYVPRANVDVHRSIVVLFRQHLGLYAVTNYVLSDYYFVGCVLYDSAVRSIAYFAKCWSASCQVEY